VEGLDKLKNTEEDSKSKTNDGAAIKDIWEEAKQAANLVLQKYTLLDLCEKRDSQKNLDIMYYI
jgi:DNA-binding IscR family transcriptional regulator